MGLEVGSFWGLMLKAWGLHGLRFSLARVIGLGCGAEVVAFL